MIEFKATGKGFLVGTFKDRYGAECSIQESSYQEEPCVWLGVEAIDGEVVPNGRMHLTQESAKELLEVLRFFVNEGCLGKYSAEDFKVGDWVVGIGESNEGVKGRVVEVKPESFVEVQDQAVYGKTGRHSTLWENVPRMWEPTSPPSTGRSFFDHLSDG